MVLFHHNDHARLVPLGREIARLVLDQNVVTDAEGGKLPGMLCPGLQCFGVRCLRVASRCAVSACHVGMGWYLPSRTGRRSLIWWPNMTWAGGSLVTGSGVFLKVRTARWKASELRCPELPMLSVTSRFMDLTVISALQLL